MTEYRLFGAATGPSASVTDAQPISVGTEFYAPGSGLFASKLWYWRADTAQGNATVRAQVFRVDGTSTGTALGSPVTFAAPTGTGWQSVALTAPVALTANQRYRVVVWFSDSRYTATANYWTSGAGASGIDLGVFVAPNAANATGGQQSAFVYGGTNPQYPAGGGGANYWVDVTVTDALAPVVDAGADVPLHGTGTVLNRTATENAFGSTVTSRAWTITAGPAGVGSTLSTTAAISWTPTVAGTYTLQYATTTAGGTGTDTATITVATIPWVNYTSGTAPRNGTSSHTIPFGFTSTAGNLLVLVSSGPVTQDVAGWDRQLNALAASGALAVHTVTSTGQSSVTITHLAANYPTLWSVFEFPAGTNYVAGASTPTATTVPTLSGLNGLPVAVFAAEALTTNNGATPAGATWSAPFIELVDTTFPNGGVNLGTWQTLAFATDVTATSVTPVNVGTFPGPGWSLDSGPQFAVFAVLPAEVQNPSGPRVTAGGDRAVLTGGAVQLDVVATPSAGQSITGYAWSVVSGSGTLTNATTATPTYTAPGSGAGVAQLRVTVTETGGGVDTNSDSLIVGYDATIVAAENRLPGVGRGTWDLPITALGGIDTLQGFADGFSVNRNQTVNFKIAQSDGAGWSAEVYRLGYYSGNGARRCASLTPSGAQLTASQSQPTPGDVDPNTTLPSTDCGNWATTLTWTPPAWAPSGVYVAKLNRTGGGASHVMFVLRDDARTADLMVMPSDSTWNAYNAFGGMGGGLLAGNSLYYGTAVDQYNADAARFVSYNRPVVNRASANTGQVYGAVRWSNFFTGEYPMVRFLERNGYDVKYYGCIDAAADPTGALLDNVSAAMAIGHNEYWSDGMRAGWENAKALGRSLFFCASNEVFWRLVGSDLDTSGRPRTWECFKSTIAARASTSRAQWTGTWRDPDGAGKGGDSPENTLTGTIFAVNGSDFRSLVVPADGVYNQQPIWRNSAVAAQSGGAWVSPTQILGFEWDTWGPAGVSTAAASFMAAPHPQARYCSSATYTIPAGLLLVDAGDVYSAASTGTAEHRLVVHPSSHTGGITFGTGTINWALGVDNANTYQGVGVDNTSAPIQQATVNMLADMGADAATLMAGLVAPTPVQWYIPDALVTNQPSIAAGWPLGSTVIDTLTRDAPFPGFASGVGGHTSAEAAGLPPGGQLDVALFAVDPATGALVPLPHFTGLDVSPIQNAPGSVRVTYPRQGVNFAALHAVLTQDRPVEVSIWLLGRDAGSMRAVLREASGDKVDPNAEWTFAGTFLEGRMAKALVGPNDANPKKETPFAGATAGTILRTLIQRAQTRGALTDISWDSFSNTVDSHGQTWPLQASPTFTPKDTLLDVLDTLVEAGMCDWEITAEHELRLYVQDTGGRDLTVADPPVTLWAGLNTLDGPHKHSLTDTAGSLLVEGRDGLYQWVDNPTAIARMGWREEALEAAGNITDAGSLQAYGQAKSTIRGSGTQELTHGLVFGPTDPLPLTGFHIGDWVYAGNEDGLERRRVRQWVLSIRAGQQPQGSVSLTDLFAERAMQLSRRISALERGAAVVGTSTVSTDSDTLSPAAPTGVVASSLAYLDSITGQPLAQITAAWNAVITNADGTAIDDLAGYRVRWRFNTPGFPTTWQVSGTTQDATLTFSGLPQNVQIDVAAAAFDFRGHQSGWSTPFSVVTETDSTAPPTPSAPTVVNHLGVLDVHWNGLGSAGEAMPADFSHCEVHRSLASGFTPDGTTRVALELRGPGTVSYETQSGQFGQVHYFRLIAVDLLGNKSAASATGSATPNAVVDLTGVLIDAAQLADGAVTTPKIAPESVTTAHLTVAQFSENALRNGGFEDADLIDPAKAVGWDTYDDSGITYSWVRATTDSRSGTASAKVSLSNASGYGELASDTIPVQPGEKWMLECVARASRAVTGGIQMIASWGSSEFADDDGQFVGPPANLTVAWGNPISAQVSVPATVGAGLVPRWMRVVIRFGVVSGDTSPIDIWVDDVRARKVVGRAIIADAAIGSAQIENLAVQNAKVANLDVGKLSSGTGTFAMLMASGNMRSADNLGTTGGQGWIIDPAGLRLYNSSNVKTADFATTGAAYVMGTFEARQTVNDRILIQPSGAGASGVSVSEISFFSSAVRPGYINAVTGSGGTLLGMNSGRSGDFSGALQSTVRLFPESWNVFVNTAPYPTASSANQVRGGQMSGSTSNAMVEYYNSSGVQRSRAVFGAGTIDLEARDTSGVLASRFVLNTSQAFMQGPGTPSINIDNDNILLFASGDSYITVADGDVAMVENLVVKSFVIPHPQDDPEDPQRYLVHACLEGPDAGVIYRGTAFVEGGLAVVALPEYFDALVGDDVQVFVQPALITGLGGRPKITSAAASTVSGGTFHICSSAPDGTPHHWMVVATRKDTPFPVEPRRSDVKLGGSGPYRYILPPQESA